MATRTITGIRDKSIAVSTFGYTYHVDENAIVIASGSTNAVTPVAALYEKQNAQSPVAQNTFSIDGRLVGYEKGIETFGIKDRINIGSQGEVSGTFAVIIRGDGSEVTNRGNIFAADGYGIYDRGSHDSRIHNYGSLRGNFGIVGDNVDGTIVTNEASGRILVSTFGVQFSSIVGASATFVNHGVVRTSGDFVYVGSRENDIVTNDGVLQGSVVLADGQDRIDTRGGIILGAIFGGNGDDTLITDNASYTLSEDANAGTDTVKASVSYTLTENVERLFLLGKANIDGTGNGSANTLVGNVGNNRLTGGSGADGLFGGKGDDVLSGGADADIFTFVTGGGHDTITDLTANVDRVDLSGWAGVNNFTEVIAHAHDRPDGVLIRFGDDSLFIQGLPKAELTNSDFIFTT